jgi:hypothetical protein
MPAPSRIQGDNFSAGNREHAHWAGRESLPNLRRDVDDWPAGGPGHPKTEALAKGLGWFSIGLGLVEVCASRTLARVIGLGEHHPALLPLLGLREIATGVGILATRRPTGWMWARVAGDAVDLTLLGTALAADDSETERVAAATAAVAGVTAADVFCAWQLGRDPG